jgi:hypothetical protein
MKIVIKFTSGGVGIMTLVAGDSDLKLMRCVNSGQLANPGISTLAIEKCQMMQSQQTALFEMLGQTLLLNLPLMLIWLKLGLFTWSSIRD